MKPEATLLSYILECEDGCTLVKVERINWGPLYINQEEVEGKDDITFSLMAYFQSSYDVGLWKAFKKKLELIWCIITGREYFLWDIVMTEEHMNDFKKFMETV